MHLVAFHHTYLLSWPLSLESVVTADATMKESIEERKVAKGNDKQAVQEWAEEFEESVDEAD